MTNKDEMMKIAQRKLDILDKFVEEVEALSNMVEHLRILDLEYGVPVSKKAKVVFKESCQELKILLQKSLDGLLDFRHDTPLSEELNEDVQAEKELMRESEKLIDEENMVFQIKFLEEQLDECQRCLREKENELKELKETI